jgi:hypothetical protein
MPPPFSLEHFKSGRTIFKIASGWTFGENNNSSCLMHKSLLLHKFDSSINVVQNISGLISAAVCYSLF